MNVELALENTAQISLPERFETTNIEGGKWD